MIKWKPSATLFAASLFVASGPAQGQATSPPAPAQPSPGRQIGGYISDADYPREAMRAGQQGTVGMRVSIGADGRVTRCDVEQSSRSPSLDEKSCEIVRERFRYEPARTPQGRAVASVARRRIIWRLPSVPPTPPGGQLRTSYQTTFLILTAGVGRSSTCARQSSIGATATQLPLQACANAFAPALVWAAERGNVSRLTRVVAFLVQGQTLPEPPADWGAVLLRSEALVTIAPNGTTIRCVPTRSERAPDAGSLTPVDPCADAGGWGSTLVEPSSNGAPRQGQVIIATYAQRGQAEDR